MRDFCEPVRARELQRDAAPQVDDEVAALLDLLDPMQVVFLAAVAGVFGWLWAKTNGRLDVETMGGAMAGGAAFIVLGFVIDWTNGAPWDWGVVAVTLAIAAASFVSSALMTLVLVRWRD